ncbi:MAG: twin-arginine translocase subunit TatC [Nitrospirae bacterium]|nr:twin-arginine translocase subunit TatC [Nitrospirota bacterium]
MPFMQHLDELRVRLVRAAIAIGCGMTGAFLFSEQIIAWLIRPVDTPMVFLSPGEAFWANLKVAFLGGLILALPVVLYQAWKFLEPGLYPEERRLGLAFIISATLLFVAGVLFCAYVVFPLTIGFLLSYKTEGLTPMLAIGTYVDFNVKFFLAFGIIFELPPVITLLARLGLVTPQKLSANRKYAVLGAFVVAAVLTPTPDVFNQLLMAVPLMLLYEVGILCARWFGKRPAR